MSTEQGVPQRNCPQNGDPLNFPCPFSWVQFRNVNSKFCRLVEVKDFGAKEKSFFDPTLWYTRNVDDFRSIPTGVVAYWVPARFIENFKNGESIEKFAELTGSQNITGDNSKYLRYFWEIDKNDINQNKWVFYAKGGDYRKVNAP